MPRRDLPANFNPLADRRTALLAAQKILLLLFTDGLARNYGSPWLGHLHPKATKATHGPLPEGKFCRYVLRTDSLDDSRVISTTNELVSVDGYLPIN